MADGVGRAIRQPRHPDPFVKTVRWSITEGGVLQAIGRPRGVRRAVRITLLAELALPLTVATVDEWRDAQPDRLTVATAEAGLHGRAMPFAPGDMHRARADLWYTVKAAERDLEKSNTPQPL
ncbi:MAG TPA: hypothetical protein VHS58_02065 [Acetobacteraceae bacterium]|jgi:hypothetical protein|nr:hypothetical protein [Acetobacteraceae bacterium]